MKIEAYVILQAEALEFKGIKGNGHDPRFGTFYPNKEDARDYLLALVSQIKHEQSIGWRTTNNLDAQKSLDFLIQKVTIIAPDEGMIQRGWKLGDG